MQSHPGVSISSGVIYLKDKVGQRNKRALNIADVVFIVTLLIIINAWYDIQQRLITSINLNWLSWNGNVESPIFFITSQVPPFSSPQHKQKAWQQYQLYMQEANKGIYFTTNSLIERC